MAAEDEAGEFGAGHIEDASGPILVILGKNNGVGPKPPVSYGCDELFQTFAPAAAEKGHYSDSKRR
jgi:hypothetical protein